MLNFVHLYSDPLLAAVDRLAQQKTVVARREGDKVVAVLSIAAEEEEEEVVQLWKNVRGLRSGTAPLQLSLPHSRKPLFAQF